MSPAMLLRKPCSAKEQVSSLSHQILRVQEEERKRISRELHDVIAQTLVGINMHLRALSAQATVDPQGLKKKIARTQRLVEQSVDVVHRFARELRPSVLDHLGLVPALRTHLQELARHSAIRVRFTAPKGIDQLESETCTVLYRISQEALANVVQHAQATRVTVSLYKIPGCVGMAITDNGRGFAPLRTSRLGLLGMRERADMIGGKVIVDSAPGHGTTVRVEVPVPAWGAGSAPTAGFKAAHASGI